MILSGKGGLTWGVRGTCAISRAPYGPSAGSTIRYQMHYLLSKSWPGAFSSHLTTCPPFLLCHKPPSSLDTALWLASVALAGHSGGGGGVEISGDSRPDQRLAPLSSLWRDVSCPSGRGSEVSPVQNPMLSKEFSFFQEPPGCTELGEAQPIDAWAGLLGPQARRDLWQVQTRVPCTWLMSRWKYFASAYELGFGGQKNPFVKTG